MNRVVIEALENPEPAEEKTRFFELPKDCPVKPLGQDISGTGFYYQSASKLVTYLKAGEHGKSHLLGLFAPKTRWLFDHYPQMHQDREGNWIPKPNTFKAEHIQPLLMDAAAKRGVWNEQVRSRGAGCWVDDAGRLVVHRGEKVRFYAADGQVETHDPGMINEMFYPRFENLGDESFERTRAAGKELLALVEKWAWQGELDSKLALGWIGAALLGAALPWRPMLWVRGESGSGKSTFHNFIKSLFGNNIYALTDATEAGVRQLVQNTALPVAIDELENKQDNRKAVRLIEQVRLASSGSESARGSSDHRAATFTLRSCYLFSSILIPPLEKQDANRINIINLKKLRHDSKMVLPPSGELKTLRRRILGRLIETWPKFEQVNARWWSALRERNADDRQCDQLGTLLSIADMLLLEDDGLDHPLIDASFDGLGEILQESLDQNAPDWQSWLEFLLASPPQKQSGSIRLANIGEMLDEIRFGDQNDLDRGAKIKTLSRLGLKLHDDGKVFSLLVANSTPGLAELHSGTHWSGGLGAVNSGWSQVAATIPGAERHQSGRFGAIRGRGVKIPIGIINKMMGRGDG